MLYNDEKIAIEMRVKMNIYKQLDIEQINFLTGRLSNCYNTKLKNNGFPYLLFELIWCIIFPISLRYSSNSIFFE